MRRLLSGAGGALAAVAVAVTMATGDPAHVAARRAAGSDGRPVEDRRFPPAGASSRPPPAAPAPPARELARPHPGDPAVLALAQFGSPPDPVPPLRRALLVGDSVMFDLVPALEAALAAAGVSVRSEAAMGMGLTRTAFYDWRARWPLLVREVRPEVVVVLVGAWDVPHGGDARLGDGARRWQARVRSAAADAGRSLAVDGADVVWLGLPPVRPLEGTGHVEAINGIVRDAVRALPDGRYVDTAAALAPSGRYVESVDGVRIRKVDGVHVCADGAARAAGAVVDALRRRWTIVPRTMWQVGPWRADVRYSPAWGCPARPGVGPDGAAPDGPRPPQRALT